MRRTYGLILDSHPTGCTRAVISSDGSVTIQKLRIAQEVTLTLSELEELNGAVAEETCPDAVLRMLQTHTPRVTGEGEQDVWPFKPSWRQDEQPTSEEERLMGLRGKQTGNLTMEEG